MIAARRFDQFVVAFIEQYRKDQLEKTRWEYWLHRVFDKSYQEYVDSLGMKPSSAAPAKDEQIKAVRRSYEILNGFSSAKKVGENGGIQASWHDSD